MAQYDVYANPSRSAADGIPYVVVIQSDLLNALATRMTMPLAVSDNATKVPTALCPVIIVKGKRLHALAHYAAPLPAKALRGCMPLRITPLRCLPRLSGARLTTWWRKPAPWCPQWTRCCPAFDTRVVQPPSQHEVLK